MTFELDKTSFNCSNIGENTIIFTATDSKGNKVSKSVTVIIEDKVAPIVVTQNFTAQLDATGNATITTANINNGSSDNCSIKTLALDKTTFSCANIGVNTVTLTVEDVNGNVASKTATVTVQDNIAPVISVNDNFTAQLDATGNAVITAAQINKSTIQLLITVTLLQQ